MEKEITAWEQPEQWRARYLRTVAGQRARRLTAKLLEEDLGPRLITRDCGPGFWERAIERLITGGDAEVVGLIADGLAEAVITTLENIVCQDDGSGRENDCLHSLFVKMINSQYPPRSSAAGLLRSYALIADSYLAEGSR